MDKKTFIYIKQYDQPCTPVTVRLEWLADGTIIPRLYWMPDGSCYKVTPRFEMTPLAYLKDRDVGLRFKVKAEQIETPEHDENLLHTQHETYLYLANPFFCGKNIVDERYGHACKQFIPVTIDVFPDCTYQLVYFEVRDMRFMVEKTISIEPQGSFIAGGVGICHKIKARQINANDDDDPVPNKSVRRLASLYFEINKWFVTTKSSKKSSKERGH